MSLDDRVHVRAWLLEEIEYCLSESSTDTLLWADTFLWHLWQELSIAELITEASFILPPQNLGHFLSWLVRNYPREAIASLVCILQTQHAAIQNARHY